MKNIVFASWTLLAVACSALAGPHPNVLLLMVDDLRPALGCYGDTTAITPSIDALATMGVTFSRAYAQQALCGPSRTSLLTSRRPSSTGVVDVHRYWRHHGNYTTLPQHFRQHGYYTASAGKIFHPGICSNFTDDALYSWSGTPYHPSTQAYKNAPACGPHRNASDIVCPVTVGEQPEKTLPDMQTAHYAISFLHRWKRLQKNGGPVRRAAAGPCKGRGCEQPFFLAVGFHKPHIPLKYPREFLDLYPLSRVPLPPNRLLPPRLPPVAFNPWNDLRWRHDIASLNLTFPYQPMPDDYARRIIQSYYAATSYTDLLIGDLLSVTERLFPDTVVALLGDHGWSLGEHQEWSKFSNYEVATRVPLIVAGIRGYEKARRKLLIASKAGKDTSGFSKTGKDTSGFSKTGKDISDSGGGTHAFSSNGSTRNLRLSRKFRNNDSSKRKTSTDQAFDSISDNNKIDDPHLYTSSRYRNEKVFSQHKRKQMKLYLKIRRTLGRYFPKWRGIANKHDLDYEEYWRFSEWFSRPEAGADNVQGRVQPETKFSRHQRSSLEKNRSHRWTGNHLPMRRNVTYDGIVELVDLFPTLADLAGIQKVPVCQSKSVFRKVNDENQILPLDVKNRVDVKLCTEGHSLSSIIIDNSNRNMDPHSDPSPALTLPHPLNQWPRETSENDSPSLNNTILKAFEVSWIASKQRQTSHHLNASPLTQPSSSPPSEPSNSRCSASLSVGRVGISQYPRPSLTPSQHPDSDQPRLEETIVMGYSMRSLCYRYTLWVAFNSTTFLPNFDIMYGEELYDHRTDPGENRNLLWPQHTVALSAKKRLRMELGLTPY